MARNLTAALIDGYAHRDDLRERGWAPDAIRRAVRAEGLEIVRRSWVIAPSAHRLLRRAAVSGGILTCLSAAEAYGAWRPGHDAALHLAFSPSSSVRPAVDVRPHRSTGVVPRSRRRLIDRVENVLAIAATCLPHDDALAVWESFLNKGQITVERLDAVAWRGDRARRRRDEASALSDSGLETHLVSRLRRAGVAVAQQVRIEGAAVDGLIGRYLVVQTDGFAFHSDARVRRANIAHDRRLRLLGYSVLRYDYHEVVNGWPAVEAEILAAVAQGLHLSPRGAGRRR